MSHNGVDRTGSSPLDLDTPLESGAPAKAKFLSRAYQAISTAGRKYPDTRTAIVSALVIGILIAAAALGIHYGMQDGFAGLDKMLNGLEHGFYIGVGAGAGAILTIGGITTVIHKLLMKYSPPEKLHQSIDSESD